MLVQRSWFRENGLFYTILALVLLIHFILLTIRLYKELQLADIPSHSTPAPPLKVKILASPEYREMLKRQIVQSDESDLDIKPKDSRFLSDKDRSFARETLARKIDKFNRGGKGQQAKDLSLSDLAAFAKNHNPLKEGAKAIAKAKRMPAKAGEKKGDLQKMGVSSTNDFVEGVALGDTTYLNTTEYKYYGFFFRIRQKLEQFWGKSIQDKAHALMKAGRAVASDSNLITSLEVTLNEMGEIVAIAIKGTSGIKELDDAAVESFNDAGPFPNPPKGLIVNGLVKVEWGFVVQASESIF